MRLLVVVALCLFLCLAVGETTQIRFRLARLPASQRAWLQVQAHAGYPQRLFPLTVAFSVPRSLQAKTASSETATMSDLPGLYAAIYLNPRTASGYRDLGLATAATASTLPPALRLTSLGRDHHWPCNTSLTATADLSGLGPVPSQGQSQSHGTLLLGAGSAVWLKARYAHVTRSELLLTDEPPVADLKKRRAFPCMTRDSEGRCVLSRQGHYTLEYQSQTIQPKRFEGRVILDPDAPTSTLPGRLMVALTTGHIQRVTWSSLLVANARDVIPDPLRESGTGPLYAVAIGSSSSSSDDLILGGQWAQRVFSEMTYDSSEATWYVLAADVSETYSIEVRWVLVILLVVQSVLLGRELLSPTHLMLRHLLGPTLKGQSISSGGSNPNVLPVAWAVSLALVALLQIVLGQVYVGSGADVEPTRALALWDFGIANLVCTAVALGELAVVRVLITQGGKATTWSLEYMAGAAYVCAGLGGMTSALLPRAAIGVPDLTLLAILVALQLFFLVYNSYAASVVLEARLLYPRQRRTTFRRTTLLWLAFLLLALGAVVTLVVMGARTVVAEAARQFNTQHDERTDWNFANLGLILILIGAGFLAHSETLATLKTLTLRARQ